MNKTKHEAEIVNQEFEMYSFHQHSLLEQAGEHRKVVAEEQTTKPKTKE